LLTGALDEVPALEVLRAAVEQQLAAKQPPQMVSTVDALGAQIANYVDSYRLRAGSLHATNRHLLRASMMTIGVWARDQPHVDDVSMAKYFWRRWRVVEIPVSGSR
jgi:hypothetical protein